MRHEAVYSNKMLRLAAVVLCLVLITTYLTAGLYARYVASDRGEDNARVAVFEIKQSGTLTKTFNFEVTPKTNTTVGKIVLDNKSETDVSYKVKVTKVTNNLPINLTLKREGVTDSGSSVKTGTLDANEGTSSYVLNVKWNESSNKNFLYHREIDQIIIQVECEQID